MKKLMIDMETATKNLQAAAKSLWITMREASEGLQSSAKYISSEQALKQINACFKTAEYDLRKGFSSTKL